MDRRIWQHSHPDPQLHPDIAAVDGMNPTTYLDRRLRSNNHPSSNISVEIPSHLTANPGTAHNPHLHSFASSSSRLPPDYVQSEPSLYNSHANTCVDSQMGYGRANYKRKNPDTALAFHRGSNNMYYSAGSSSNIPASSPSMPPYPIPGPQYSTWEPVSMPVNHRSYNLPTPDEGTYRNVRSRPNPTGEHSTSTISYGLAARGHWRHPPLCSDSQQRVHSSGSGSYNHEMNQSHNVVGYPHNPRHSSRSSSTPLPTHHSMPSQAMVVDHSDYGLRATPYSTISSSSYPSVDGRRSGHVAIPPSRHSRPLPNVGQSSERSRRSRPLYDYDRYHTFSGGDSSRSRWVSEGSSMIGRSIIYDSRNLFDQHRDMRLDVDNMSYEELLALGERIGNVSTGLSENTITSCLKETVYCSSNDSEDESCVICMEEYKDKEIVGRLKCGHGYHATCIKEWLVIKNVCPICKSEASKEK